MRIVGIPRTSAPCVGGLRRDHRIVGATRGRRRNRRSLSHDGEGRPAAARATSVGLAPARPPQPRSVFSFPRRAALQVRSWWSCRTCGPSGTPPSRSWRRSRSRAPRPSSRTTPSCSRPHVRECRASTWARASKGGDSHRHGQPNRLVVGVLVSLGGGGMRRPPTPEQRDPHSWDCWARAESTESVVRCPAGRRAVW
jgi:hypothetical protein